MVHQSWLCLRESTKNLQPRTVVTTSPYLLWGSSQMYNVCVCVSVEWTPTPLSFKATVGCLTCGWASVNVCVCVYVCVCVCVAQKWLWVGTALCVLLARAYTSTIYKYIWRYICMYVCKIYKHMPSTNTYTCKYTYKHKHVHIYTRKNWAHINTYTNSWQPQWVAHSSSWSLFREHFLLNTPYIILSLKKDVLATSSLLQHPLEPRCSTANIARQIATALRWSNPAPQHATTRTQTAIQLSVAATRTVNETGDLTPTAHTPFTCARVHSYSAAASGAGAFSSSSAAGSGLSSSSSSSCSSSASGAAAATTGGAGALPSASYTPVRVCAYV